MTIDDDDPEALVLRALADGDEAPLLFAKLKLDDLRAMRSAFYMDMTAPCADESTVLFCRNRLAMIDRELLKRTSVH